MPLRAGLIRMHEMVYPTPAAAYRFVAHLYSDDLRITIYACKLRHKTPFFGVKGIMGLQAAPLAQQLKLPGTGGK